MWNTIFAVVQLLLLIARYLEHRGKVNEARQAVARDMQNLRGKLGHAADTALDALDTSPASVRLDPNNRDNDRPS